MAVDQVINRYTDNKGNSYEVHSLSGTKMVSSGGGNTSTSSSSSSSSGNSNRGNNAIGGNSGAIAYTNNGTAYNANTMTYNPATNTLSTKTSVGTSSGNTSTSTNSNASAQALKDALAKASNSYSSVYNDAQQKASSMQNNGYVVDPKTGNQLASVYDTTNGTSYNFAKDSVFDPNSKNYNAIVANSGGKITLNDLDAKGNLSLAYNGTPGSGSSASPGYIDRIAQATGLTAQQVASGMGVSYSGSGSSSSSSANGGDGGGNGLTINADGSISGASVSSVNNFMSTYVDALTQQARSAQASRDAIIQGRLSQDVADQQNLINDANTNYSKTEKETQDNIYNAQENNRAQGVQRGIQYSQEQQAIEAGTSLAGEKALVDAKTQRDNSIMNIKNKISALKSNATYEMQASNDQANSEIAKAQGDAIMTDTQRQWKLQDDATAFQRQVALQNMDFDNQVKMFNMTEASKEKFYKMDEQSKKDFMALDDEYKTRYFNMEEASKEKFFKMEDAQKEKFFKMDADLQKEMFNMNAKQQEYMFNLEDKQKEKFFNLENDAKMKFMALDYSHQQSLMAQSNSMKQAEFQQQLDIEAQQQAGQGLRKLLEGTPQFQEAIKQGGASTPEQQKALGTWMDTVGIPKDKQQVMMKVASGNAPASTQQSTSNWLSNWLNSNKGSSTSLYNLMEKH